MPTHREISDDLLSELEEGGGIQPKTQAAKDRGYTAFVEFIKSVTKNDSVVVTDISDEDLGKHFSRYFFTLQVNRRIKNPDGSSKYVLDWPKAKTAEFMRSMIKCSFYEKHGIDLGDPFRFPNAKKNWGSFLEKLKSEGRADTEHYEEIPPQTYEAITKLFHDAMEVLKHRGEDNYQELLSCIPLDWQHRCHRLAQYGAQFMVGLYDGRRGCEKIENLKRDQWEKKEDDVWEFSFWQKKRGESSKNHRKDSENVSQSGIIPFLNITEHLNPGQFFADYLDLIPNNSTNPAFPNTVPKPKDQRKNFHPHQPETILFEPNRKLGKHMVGEMLPTVSEHILKLERCTNHMMRVTVIKALKRAGYDWGTVQKITGHKSLKSLIDNYDPSLDTPERANVGVAIGTAPNLKRGIGFEKVSSSLVRHDIQGSITYNEPEQMVPKNHPNKTQSSIEEELRKKPRLDNFQLNNPFFDYGSAQGKTDGVLFKIPDVQSVEIQTPIETPEVVQDEPNIYEIPEISVDELRDQTKGYNLKERLSKLLKHYTKRREQLSEQREKMSEEEEERWRICQIDYVKKAIHDKNSTNLDIEIANSILRQKEAEKTMAEERKNQRKEKGRGESPKEHENQRNEKGRKESSAISKIDMINQNKTFKKEESTKQTKAVDRLDASRQSEKNYQSIDMTNDVARIPNSIAFKSPAVQRKGQIIDLTLSPETRSIKLEKNEIFCDSLSSQQFVIDDNSEPILNYQMASPSVGHPAQMVPRHDNGMLNQSLRPAGAMMGNRHMMALGSGVGSFNSIPNVYPMPMLPRPTQEMPFGLTGGQQSFPMGHPPSYIHSGHPPSYIQSGQYFCQNSHPNYVNPSLMPYGIGQVVYPQMQAAYDPNLLSGHRQMSLNSQLPPQIMPQQGNLPRQPPQMVHEEIMNVAQHNTQGKMVQVTEKSMVRLDQGNMEATTVSVSTMRKRHPDWGELAKKNNA